MPIYYRLVPNEDPDHPNRYRAEVIESGTIDMEIIVERIVKEHPAANRAELRRRLMEDLEDKLADAQRGVRGESGPVELVPRRLLPGGTYEVQPVPVASVREAARNAKPIRIDSPADVPFVPTPEIYRDAQTGSVNELLTPGGGGEIKGNHLYRDAARDDEGLFFVRCRGGEATRVTRIARADVNHAGHPDELTFVVPATLQPGTYMLEVRGRPRTIASPDGTPDLRLGRLEQVLVVQELTAPEAET